MYGERVSTRFLREEFQKNNTSFAAMEGGGGATESASSSALTQTSQNGLEEG
jgi:hypothetical protein